MKQTLLIIPGFGESTQEEPYLYLINKYKKKYSVVTYNPRWDYNTASTWLEELEETLDSIDITRTTVIAFSLGAYITLLAAQTYLFNKIILCSVSPFFKEQLKYMPEPAKDFFGKKRIMDFMTHQIPVDILCPAVFLFGEDDWKVGIAEAKELSKKYKGLFNLVPSTGHELNENYLKQVIFHLN